VWVCVIVCSIPVRSIAASSSYPAVSTNIQPVRVCVFVMRVCGVFVDLMCECDV